MILSRRCKEAIKIALAMTLAYGLALALELDKPIWAGFAVTFISLETAGQSLHKGVLRLGGTCLAIAAALTILALFPQERWAFFGLLSIYICFCVHMMGASKSPYFWQVAGFVCGILVAEAGPHGDRAFELVVARAEETALGVAVFTIVTSLLWPTDSRAEMERSVRRLIGAQRRFLSSCFTAGRGEAEVAERKRLSGEATMELARFGALLPGAELESYEIWEVRQAWRRLHAELGALAERLELWRLGLTESTADKLRRVLPDAVSLGASLDARFAGMESLLKGQPGQPPSAALQVTPDAQAMAALPAFDKAALSLAVDQLQDLDRMSNEALAATRIIAGRSPDRAAPRDRAEVSHRYLLDPEHYITILRIFLIMWAAFLTWIYLPGLPGGTSIVFLSISLGMAFVGQPQIPLVRVWPALMMSVVLAGSIYIFVMPQLSTFLELGAVIFIVTFAICYLLAAPRLAAMRVASLAFFVAICDITNSQSYNFLTVPGTAVVLSLVIFIIAVTAYLPISHRPEIRFRRLLERFFASSQFLVGSLQGPATGAPSFVTRLQYAFHLQEVATIPGKLTGWARFLPAAALGDTSRADIEALVAAVQALAHRVNSIMAARGQQQSDAMVAALEEDVQFWRLALHDGLGELSVAPDSCDSEMLRQRLDRKLENMEEKIREALAKTGPTPPNWGGGENLYRLLGAYRGISDAIIGFVERAERIEWRRLNEARF